jgi:hypothetical protein
LIVHFDLEAIQLRYSLTQHAGDSFQPSLARPGMRFPDSQKQIATVGIVLCQSRGKVLWISYDLRDEMVVRDGVEEFGNPPKIFVGDDLLERRLR